MTQIDVDTRCSDWELRRLQDGFTTEDHMNFAAILFTNFVKTDQAVHVETGSLRGSGTAEVDHSGGDYWEGHIAYGGASFGVKPNVRYAVAELFGTSPKHGGPPAHDFMRHTRYIDDELMGPVTTFFARGIRTPHPEGFVA